MVKDLDAPSLDVVFGALSDPTRRRILELLARTECCVTDLAKPFSISLPAISKHLRVLENAGLIKRQRHGRVHRLQLRAKPMSEAAEWIERYREFWEVQLDALSRYLENHGKPNKKREGQTMTTAVEQKTILSMNRIIAAPRERVFDAWTRPEEIKIWFGPETCSVLAAQIDFRVNGEFCFDISSAERGNLRLRGTYREIMPPSKLIYTWQWDGNAELAFENSLVTVEFIELGSSTEIRLRHENLPSEEVREDHRHGWNGCFDKLEKHLAH